jgi:hypothetical protein
MLPMDCRPLILSEDDPALELWTESAGKRGDWMEEAKLIAIASHRMPFEDGADVCDSESLAEHSDHGEMRRDASI